MSDANVPGSAAAMLDAVKLQPLPQLVLLVDHAGKVLDIEDALMGKRLAFARPRRGSSAHRCLHPECREVRCALRLCITAALATIAESRIIEWEWQDPRHDFMARIHLRSAHQDTETWATLTITDITEGRRVTGSLRDANRALVEMIDRTESVHVRQTNKLDKRLRSISAELIMAQEGERRRIAADLHDGLGQWLAMAKLCLESGLAKLPESTAQSDLQKSFSHLTTAIRELRAIARNLRPSILEEFGLIATLELLCHELQLSRPKMEVLCRVNGEAADIPPPQSLAMVRILQEALNNAAKHSGATRLVVDADFRLNRAIIRIRDNGVGFELTGGTASKAGGIGLSSMRERAEQAGAKFRLSSMPRSGTQIWVSWQAATAKMPALDESGAYKTIGDGVRGDGGSAP